MRTTSHFCRAEKIDCPKTIFGGNIWKTIWGQNLRHSKTFIAWINLIKISSPNKIMIIEDIRKSAKNMQVCPVQSVSQFFREVSSWFKNVTVHANHWSIIGSPSGNSEASAMSIELDFFRSYWNSEKILLILCFIELRLYLYYLCYWDSSHWKSITYYVKYSWECLWMNSIANNGYIEIVGYILNVGDFMYSFFHLTVEKNHWIRENNRYYIIFLFER